MIKPHLPTQASEHVIPFLDFTPQWFIDCGPGSGVEALEVKEKWPDVNILRLEPSPVGFIAASRLFPAGDNSRLLNLGVWDFDCKLNLSNPYTLLNSTFRTLDEPESVIEVQVRSLDSLDQEFGPFNDVLLWIDIEGSEMRALSGADNLLGRRVIKAINVEVNGETQYSIHPRLRGHGFSKLRTYFDQGNGHSRDELWVLK